jgi:acetyl esterase/lipase
LIVTIVLAVLIGGFAAVQRYVYKRSVLSGIADVYITLAGNKKKFETVEAADAFMQEQGEKWWDGYTMPENVSFDCSIVEEQTAGMQVFRLNADANEIETAVLYLHGGAYVNPPQKVQWDTCNAVATQAGCEVVLPVYLTAPNYTYDACYEALLELYDSMLETYAPSDIVLMGDSAGGGLALGFAMWLDELGYEQPRLIVAYSPEVDITLSNPDLEAYEKLDAMLAIEGIVEMGRVWAGGADPTDYRLSPIYGDASALAPIILFAGTRELLYPDEIKFVEQAKEQGADVTYYEGENLGHCWPLYPTPEGAEALKIVSDAIAGY